MMEVVYTPAFLRQLKFLPLTIREEVIKKVAHLKDRARHRQLKVHKLTGRLKGRRSFSVNYKTRVVFSYLSSREVVLLAVGDHAIYQ